jgi:pimeloyl-ACP methyl ester carboxylesterase
MSFLAPVTFILVHGALCTSSGFEGLKKDLELRHQNVVTVDVPGRNGDGIDPTKITIQTAAKSVCNAIAEIPGDVILVGHSQGGAVITQASGDCGERVRGLVFMAAVAPLSGETAFDGLNPDRDSNFNKCVRVDAERGLFVLNKNGPLEQSFFQDLRAINPELADAALASMVSEPISIGTTKLSFDQNAYNKRPKFYIEALEDQVVSIETQRSYQKKIQFTHIYGLKTGHSGFLSQPKAMGDILLKIAQEI